MEEKDRYDKRAQYAEMIEPLVKKIKMECNLARIPVFMTFAVANSEKGTIYENEMILSSADVKLKNNAIGRILLSINGFKKEPPAHVKRAIQDLNEYLEQIRIQEGTDVLDLQLSDSSLMQLFQIVNGNDKLVPPDGILDKPITDEFLDD